MHSSISNSNDRCPDGPCLKIWIVSIVLACTILLAAELFFRRLGHKPQIMDNMAFWSIHRSRVYSDDPNNMVVLLGASRMQTDFVPEVFTEKFPNSRLVNLSINARYPVAVLRDLAQDEDFVGTVICSIKAEALTKPRWQDQQPYINYYHRQFNTNEILNHWFAFKMQKSVAVISPTLKLYEILRNLVTHKRLPQPSYITIFPDRSRRADYSKLDISAHRTKRNKLTKAYYKKRRDISPQQWLSDTMEIEKLVKKIHSRGSKVIFVRLPSTGEYYQYEENTCPKELYWDKFADLTSAAMIHFKDVPELANFDCPDTSHLDYRDAVRFTRALANEIQHRGLIAP
jgi:hypothetical protein